MTWYTRLGLLFLIVLLTQSDIALGQATPWSSLENANAFVQTFLGSVGNSGVFTQDQIDDMNSIGDTIIRAMGDFRGNVTPNKLQALNTAFASAVAEIAMSDTGGKNVEVTTEAIANALNLAFYQTTGKSNTAFVNEVYGLINTFAEASAKAVAEGQVYEEPADYKSASAPTTITNYVQSAPQRAGSNSAQRVNPYPTPEEESTPKKTEPQRTRASASAVASIDRGRGGNDDSSSEPNKSEKYPPGNGSPVGGDYPDVSRTPTIIDGPEENNANSIPRQYEPSRVPTTNNGPSQQKPSDYNPRQTESAESRATAQAGTGRDYSPGRNEVVDVPSRNAPDSASDSGPTNQGPDAYKPNSDGPKRGTTEKASAAATAIATGREPSPIFKDEQPYRVPAVRPGDNAPKDVPRKTEPEQALAAASAAATENDYGPREKPNRNVPDRVQEPVPAAGPEPDRFEPRNNRPRGPEIPALSIPVAKPQDDGLNEYKPSGNGPRKTEPEKALARATASATAREYIPIDNEEPDKQPYRIPEGPKDNNGPVDNARKTNSDEAAATASAAATAKDYNPRENDVKLEPVRNSPNKAPAASPEDYGPNDYQPRNNGPRKTEPQKASATATATAREYSAERNEQPDEEPYEVPERTKDNGPVEPSGFAPREEVKALASAAAIDKEYNPREAEPNANRNAPERNPKPIFETGPVDNGPDSYRPNSNGPSRKEPEQPLALGPKREFSPGGNEVIIEPGEQTNRPGSEDNSPNRPGGSAPRIPEPQQAAASASATARQYRPAENEIIPESNRNVPNTIPAPVIAESPNDDGSDRYRPSGNGPRKSEPVKTSATAAAAATERIYNPRRQPNREPATSPTERPANNGPNEPDNNAPRKTKATASATARVEYSPRGNEVIFEPNRNEPSRVSSPVPAATPEDYGPDRSRNGDYNPRRVEPERVQTSATATAREYERPDNPTTGPTDNGPTKPSEIAPKDEPDDVSAAASARATVRGYAPERNAVIYEPVRRVPDTEEPTNQAPDKSIPSDSGSKRPEIEDASARASATVIGRGYSPRENEPIPEPGRRLPERVPDAQASAAALAVATDQPDRNRDYEPRATGGNRPTTVGSEASATASAVANDKPNRNRDYEPRATGDYRPDRVGSGASAAASAVAVSEPDKNRDSGPRSTDDYRPDRVRSEASATAVASAESDKNRDSEPRTSSDYRPDRIGSVASATASAQEPDRLIPVRYEPSNIIASTALAAASALSYPISAQRIATAASSLASSKTDDFSNLSSVLASAVSQIGNANTDASDCDVLVEALLEIITALIHILRYARIENISYDDLNQTAQLIARSINEIFG